MVCAVERNAGYGGNDTEGDLIFLGNGFCHRIARYVYCL